MLACGMARMSRSRAKDRYPAYFSRLQQQGELYYCLLPEIWADRTKQIGHLVMLMVKFGLMVPLSSSGDRAHEAATMGAVVGEQAAHNTKFLVPALLKDQPLPTLSPGVSQTCMFVFGADMLELCLRENCYLTREQMAKQGFLPHGLFPRIQGKVLHHAACSSTFKSMAHRSGLQCCFGNVMFTMRLVADSNAVEVCIASDSPMVLAMRLSDLIQQAVQECMPRSVALVSSPHSHFPQ